MAQSKKTALDHFMGTVTWRFLRPINIAVVYPRNEFSGARSPRVPYDSEVQVLVKHDFSETFERDTFDGEFVGKGGLYYICELFVQNSVSQCI